MVLSGGQSLPPTRTDTGTHGPTFVRGVRRIRPIPDSEKWVKVGACQDRVVEYSRGG